MSALSAICDPHFLHVIVGEWVLLLVARDSPGDVGDDRWHQSTSISRMMIARAVPAARSHRAASKEYSGHAILLPMIPLGDVVPRRTWPLVTAATAVTFALAILLFHVLFDRERRIAVVWDWGASPRNVPWPALLTAIWIEPSWVVGTANLAALALFGPAVEDRFGHVRFLVLLTVGAWIGVLAGSAAFRPPALPGTGAAALAAPVMAAHLRLFPDAKLVFWVPAPTGGTLHEPPAIWAIGLWAALVPAGLVRDVSAGLSSLIPLAGVAAAMLIGLASARLMPIPERLRVEWWDRLADDASAAALMGRPLP
jgi:membrane associated rhomboid family serine protease